MAVKNYGIHDKWTDLDKLNNVDIKSVDGVIESVKINGEEAGGGGGSSDFSTAEVTVIGYNGATEFIPPSFPYVADNNTTVTMAEQENSKVYTVVLYKGSAWGVIRGADIKAMTGGVELSQDEEFLIVTGNGTLTIEPWEE